MNHHRAVIREAVVAALAAANTLAGARVDEEPYDADEEFPSLAVEDESETQERLSVDSTLALQRSYRFIVTAQVCQNTLASRARDQLLAEVEACLATATLPGVLSIRPLSYQPASRNEGERRIRIGHQLFEAVYMTSQADPSTSL